MQQLENDRVYAEARQRLEEEKSFYVHLATYVAVISLLWVLNYFNNPGHWWAIWPTFGWGIGLFFHAFGVFGKNAIFSKSWEERRMKELMDREKRNLE